MLLNDEFTLRVKFTGRASPSKHRLLQLCRSLLVEMAIAGDSYLASGAYSFRVFEAVDDRAIKVSSFQFASMFNADSQVKHF